MGSSKLNAAQARWVSEWPWLPLLTGAPGDTSRGQDLLGRTRNRHGEVGASKRADGEVSLAMPGGC